MKGRVVDLMLSLNSFKKYEDIAKELGAVNAKIINASEVVVDNRSRLKCRFGCSSYFINWTCPPRHGIQPWTFKKRLLSQYSVALLVHAQDPETSQKISIEIEKRAFLDGYSLVFSLSDCTLCEECTCPEEPCRHPEKARPAAQSFGIDIFATAKKQDYPIYTLKNKEEEQNWYSIVLLD